MRRQRAAHRAPATHPKMNRGHVALAPVDTAPAKPATTMRMSQSTMK